LSPFERSRLLDFDESAGTDRNQDFSRLVLLGRDQLIGDRRRFFGIFLCFVGPFLGLVTMLFFNDPNPGVAGRVDDSNSEWIPSDDELVVLFRRNLQCAQVKFGRKLQLEHPLKILGPEPGKSLHVLHADRVARRTSSKHERRTFTFQHPFDRLISGQAL
jgi:hypothetical protein